MGIWFLMYENIIFSSKQFIYYMLDRDLAISIIIILSRIMILLMMIKISKSRLRIQ